MILPGKVLQNVGHSHPLPKSWAARCSLHMLCSRMDGQILGVPLQPVSPTPGLESYTPVTLRFSWLPPSCLQVPAEVAWPAPRPRLCSPLARGLLTWPPRVAWASAPPPGLSAFLFGHRQAFQGQMLSYPLPLHCTMAGASWTLQQRELK